MSKNKPYWMQRKEESRELDKALTDEKIAQAKWYRMMSGEQFSTPDMREDAYQKCVSESQNVKIEMFASLPEE